MDSNKISMTVRFPSDFGMPACGHASRTVAPRPSQVRGTTVPVAVRDASAVAVTGDLLIARTYFPGTAAWRPPIC